MKRRIVHMIGLGMGVVPFLVALLYAWFEYGAFDRIGQHMGWIAALGSTFLVIFGLSYWGTAAVGRLESGISRTPAGKSPEPRVFNGKEGGMAMNHMNVLLDWMKESGHGTEGRHLEAAATETLLILLALLLIGILL